MAEAPKKSFFDKFKFWKRKRQSKPRLPSKTELNRHSTGTPVGIVHPHMSDHNRGDRRSFNTLEQSAYYSEIPVAHFETADYQNETNPSDTYLEPGVRKNSDVTKEDGAILAEKERQKEQERVKEILEKQKVTDKTLYVNFEEPPPIPPKSTKPEGKSDEELAQEEKKRIMKLLEKQKVTDHTLFVNFEPPPTIPPRGSQHIEDDASQVYDIPKPRENKQSGIHIQNEPSTMDKPKVNDTEYDDSSISDTKTTEYICVRGLSEKTTKETLSDFLEVKTDMCVDSSSIVYCGQGIAVVPCNDNIDMNKLTTVLRERSLDKSFLEVCTVPHPKSVLISSEEKMPTDSEIRHHFENDFGHITEYRNEVYCRKVISFGDAIVVSRISSKSSHCIKDARLTISPLYECAFGKVYDLELHPTVRIPSGMTLQGIDSLLESFIRSSPKIIKMLDDCLQKCFAKLSLEENIFIKCLLTKLTSDVQFLSNGWEDRVKKCWDQCISKFIHRDKVEIPLKYAEAVKKFMQAIEVTHKEEILILFHEEDVPSLEIIGLTETVHKAVFDVERYLKSLEKKEQEKTIDDNNCTSKETGDFVAQTGRITPQVDVETVKVQELVATIENVQTPDSGVKTELYSWTLESLSSDHKKLMQSQQILEMIKQKLKEKNIRARFNFSDNVITGHTTNEQSAKLVEDVILNECIAQDRIPLEKTVIPAVCLPQWTEFENQITVKEYYGRVIISHDDSGQIIITCEKDLHWEVLKRVNEILFQLKEVSDSEDLHHRSSSKLDARPPKTSHPPMTCPNGTTISVVTGELGTQKADVLVSSVSSDLNMSLSATGKNLLKYGGQSLQEESHRKFPNGIQFGDLAVIDGGNLQCRCLYLGSIPHWSKEENKAVKTITRFIDRCLSTAVDNGFQSITFAALGTGALAYPSEIVAELMYDCVINMDKRLKGSPKSLAVTFCIYGKDTKTLKAFQDQENLAMIYRKYITPKHHIKVIIEQISLLKKEVDVMVCSASKDLDFKHGKLLTSLRQEAGTKMEEDCRRAYPNGIEPGQIAVVRPGNLPCSRIYFGTLPPYESDHNSAKKVLKKFVYDCLEMATKYKKSSIAFPSLGTGKRQYPHNITAKVMYDAVKKYDKKAAISNLRVIYFVVPLQDELSLNAFYEEENRQTS